MRLDLWYLIHVFACSVCHYIASTKIKLFSRKSSDEEQDVNKDMSNVTNYIIDSKHEQKTDHLMRRPTIANLKAYHNKTKGQGEHINLEKQFLEKFSNIGQFIRFSWLSQSFPLDLDVEKDSKLAKRLSLKRRGTIHVLKQRQGSFIKQKTGVAFQDNKTSSIGSYVYNGFDSDLGDDLTDFSGSCSARNSVHFDVSGDTEF